MDKKVIRRISLLVSLLSSASIFASEVIATNTAEGNNSVSSTPITNIRADPEVMFTMVPTTPVEKNIILQSSAVFAHNSDFPAANSEQSLLKLIGNLEQLNGIQSIHVIGHTDSSGTEKDNLHLSLLRARTLQAFLQGAYPEATVTAMGMGQYMPAHPNSTLEGRHLNQRMEVRVSLLNGAEK